MSRRNVVSFYTAPARSGKTFRMVVRICDEIIPLTEGVIYTNLPLHSDLIAKYCADKYGLEVDAILARIHIIPREVEHVWKDAGQPIYDELTGRKTGQNPFDGPWEYFADKALAGATIIIDEIHNFCGNIGTPKAVANRWQKWLGELGHNQAVFICISQSPDKVHNCIKNEAQASYTIRNTGLERDPWFKIEVYDWLELWAGMFNQPYKVFVFEQETQKTEGKRHKGQRKLHRMGPPYFDFYDSFNKPIASEQTDNLNAFEHEYEKHLKKGAIRGRLSLVRWFFFKNMQALIGRGLMAAVFAGVLLYLLSGGAGDATRAISSSMARAFTGKKAEAAQSAEQKAAAGDKPVIGGQGVDLEKTKVELIRKLYEEELRKALTDKETAATELKAAKEEMERQNAIVLVTPTTIVLKRGYEYEVGQKITVGEYEGKTLKAINYRRREAVLDDGSVLRLASLE